MSHVEFEVRSSWDGRPLEPHEYARVRARIDPASSILEMTVDATFYDGSELPGRDLSKIPHPRMVETMRLLGDEARARPGRVRFLHLNHTNPALHDAQLRKEIEGRGFRIAEEGERLGL